MATRLISSAVGIVIALIIFFLHNTLVFPIAVSIVSVIILFELIRAFGCLDAKISVGISFLYAAALPFLSYGDGVKYRTIVSVSVVILLFFSFILQHSKVRVEQIMMFISATLMIPYAMSCCVVLNKLDDKHGIIYVVLALAGAWLADSGAYFVGTFCGKHKLCPNISPKKTIEGLLGGVVTNAILFAIFNFVYCQIMADKGVLFTVSYPETVVLGIVCALIGTIGDLSASLVKRQFNVKDYGKIMPGHGGLLDRFDSVLFVAPFICAFLSVAQIYIPK